MNYEDDEALRAPVWDELNTKAEESQKETGTQSRLLEPHNNEFGGATRITNELSKSFANISTRNEYDETQSNDKADDDDREFEDEDEHKLINILAPKEDPLADLKSQDNEFGSITDTNEPLFGGSSIISPIMGNTSLNLVSNTSGESSNKKTGKPHLLFNASTRLRRRKPDFGKSSNGNETHVKVEDDPLGKAQKENEFIEESLDYEFKKGSRNGTNSETNILDKINEPLYKLSPRKAQHSFKNDKPQNESVKNNADVPEKVVEKKIPIPFKVEVKDPIKVGELTSTHVEYTVLTESELVDANFSQVTRRYRDFRWLYRQLQSNHWGKIIPPPPEKQTVGRFKRDFIENRRFQMDIMLKRIASDPTLQIDKDFLMFLTSENFVNDSKLREHMTASGAYNDNNDLSEIHISEIELLGPDDAVLVLRNGGIDGELNKGFMNFSLSTQPRYNEPDPYFNEERERFSILEEQLKQLYKSLELIDTERNELAMTISEFSKTISNLAKLEVTRKSSDLLIEFSNVHDSIKESIERNSLQQSLTLGVTLDEYVRTLLSVRATFNQRAKLGYFLVIVENDLNKKKNQFEKSYPTYKKSEHINDERCKNLMTECQVLDKRYNMIKERWQKIADDIKEEVKVYETEKIEEFRNSMEISLESAIESQKECIELWETFYQNSL